MAKAKTVWGIDVGQCALKALKVRLVEGRPRVEAFDLVEHPQILSEPEVDRPQLMRNALEQFLARNDVADSEIVVSVPGQSSFTRFVKLPPVEPKKIPDIVRFEAEQQIPFDIEEVVWRWQTFQDADSPDVELGLFAMKRTDVDRALGQFEEVALPVDAVQMAPLALYNFMIFDGQRSRDAATLLMDIGADQTDLVVSDGARIWTRSIQIGGNNFTEALVKTFKLSFRKAERLKRTAATSKYAKQIFQAMRPVFSDLVQEIQRSIGYYTSLHREARFRRVVGLGNGFRLPGLQKFLEQNLNLSVSRVDSFSELEISPDVSAASVNEHILTLAVAYGLAVQGLGAATVSTNLLPREILRRRQWRRKRPYFIAASAVLLAALGVRVWSTHARAAALEPTQQFRQAERISRSLNRLRSQYVRLQRETGDPNELAGAYLEMYEGREFWPAVQEMVAETISRVASDQKLLEGGPEQREQLQAIPRTQRQVVYIESLRGEYKQFEVEPARQPGRSGRSEGGLEVTLVARTPLPRRAAATQIITPLQKESARRIETLDVFRLLGELPKVDFLAERDRARDADAPVEPEFTRFQITWRLLPGGEDTQGQPRR
jgi:type IV pilus assembly protein PilM